jgi:hypothetical protein
MTTTHTIKPASSVFAVVLPDFPGHTWRNYSDRRRADMAAAAHVKAGRRAFVACGIAQRA